MHEEKIFFRSGNLRMEGLYQDNKGLDGVIITHPHPQMGGNMYNNVVEALVSAFNSPRYSTLRFNFRGVGRSEGFFDNGRGEAEDVMAAHEFLLRKEKSNIILTGYSFGAFVDMEVFSRLESLDNIILVAPYLSFDHINFSNNSRKKGLIICGDEDQFCKIGILKNWAEINYFQLKIIEGADHFFLGAEEVIIEHVRDYLSANGSR